MYARGVTGAAWSTVPAVRAPWAGLSRHVPPFCFRYATPVGHAGVPVPVGYPVSRVDGTPVLDQPSTAFASVVSSRYLPRGAAGRVSPFRVARRKFQPGTLPAT